MSRATGVKRGRSTGEDRIIPKALKVDSTNRVLLDAAEDEHAAMTDMVNLLYQHPSHSHHMLAHLRKRLAVEEEEAQKQSGIRSFGSNTFGDILKDEEFAMRFRPKHSDLTVKDLGNAKASNADSLNELMTCAAQLTKATVLSDGCRDGEVASRFILVRMAETKSADVLRTFKAAGGFCENGVLNWTRVGRYAFGVEDGYIKTITHRPTNKTLDVSWLKLDDGWQHIANYSDQEAMIEKPPLKPQKLARFFGRTEGPNGMPKFSKQNFKSHVEQVKIIEAIVKCEREAAGQSGGADAKEIREELSRAAAGKKTTGHSKALEAAMKALADKRASRRGSLVDA